MSAEKQPQLDPDFVIRLRIVLSRLARQLNLSMASSGLSPTQAAIFTAIARSGPVGLSQLAERENVNSSMLSRVVGKLESAGMIERAPDPEDRRAFIVCVTARGRATHERIKREKSRWLQQRLQELEPQHAGQLVAALPALEDLAEILREPEE